MSYASAEMTDLDQELKDALAEAEAQQSVSGTSVPSGPQHAPKAPSEKKSFGLLFALLLMGGSILFIVFSSQDQAIYSTTVDELLADSSRFQGRTLKLEGELVKGTLKRRAEPCEYRFRLTKNQQQIDVRYPACIVPDTFRDVPGMDVQVTAEGELDADGHFEATHIMAKCPSKYEMKQKAAGGESAPHEMMIAPVEEASE
ncbi:MAG: cytochrome c maturation protein CcmE [Polyangiaceae bacterium]|nr:cytochrome c maturation protein CcmE [Polyangiaceae bacterium]